MAVLIKGKYLSDLRCEMTHDESNATILTDAPKDNQGKGESFSPTDLVASALASCMMTIIAIRAKTKKIVIGNPTYTIKKFMMTNPRKIEKIEININYNVILTENDKEYLETEAKTCPVALSIHPNIKQEINFKYN